MKNLLFISLLIFTSCTTLYRGYFDDFAWRQLPDEEKVFIGVVDKVESVSGKNVNLWVGESSYPYFNCRECVRSYYSNHAILREGVYLYYLKTDHIYVLRDFK